MCNTRTTGIHYTIIVCTSAINAHPQVKLEPCRTCRFYIGFRYTYSSVGVRRELIGSSLEQIS